MSTEQKIRVIMYREEEKWVGQCLEYDIRVQADTTEKLTRYLDLAINATMEDSLERHGKPFANIDPAPKRFQDLWEKRASTIQPRDELPKHNLSFALCA